MVHADTKRTRIEEQKIKAPVVFEVHVLEESTLKRSTLEEGELVEISEGKTTQVVAELEPKVKTGLISCLRCNSDIFAKDVHDLTRIDPTIAEHHLHITNGVHLVK